MSTTSDRTVLGTDFLSHLSTGAEAGTDIEQRRTSTHRGHMATTQAREGNERFAEALRTSTRVKASWLLGWASL